jgi:hypothetical protein
MTVGLTAIAAHLTIIFRSVGLFLNGIATKHINAKASPKNSGNTTSVPLKVKFGVAVFNGVLIQFPINNDIATNAGLDASAYPIIFFMTTLNHCIQKRFSFNFIETDWIRACRNSS